jgi:hypothetical protein
VKARNGDHDRTIEVPCMKLKPHCPVTVVAPVALSQAPMIEKTYNHRPVYSRILFDVIPQEIIEWPRHCFFFPLFSPP